MSQSGGRCGHERSRSTSPVACVMYLCINCLSRRGSFDGGRVLRGLDASSATCATSRAGVDTFGNSTGNRPQEGLNPGSNISPLHVATANTSRISHPVPAAERRNAARRLASAAHSRPLRIRKRHPFHDLIVSGDAASPLHACAQDRRHGRLNPGPNR